MKINPLQNLLNIIYYDLNQQQGNKSKISAALTYSL